MAAGRSVRGDTAASQHGQWGLCWDLSRALGSGGECFEHGDLQPSRMPGPRFHTLPLQHKQGEPLKGCAQSWKGGGCLQLSAFLSPAALGMFGHLPAGCKGSTGGCCCCSFMV